eukprot:GHVU01093290.1.p2 GENE.GHVU01093290.1~~GHVU01093290.1.p2  ORF type:complete len:175 (-),score=25.42 GHVU01093290.1:27-551(-)
MYVSEHRCVFGCVSVFFCTRTPYVSYPTVLRRRFTAGTLRVRQLAGSIPSNRGTTLEDAVTVADGNDNHASLDDSGVATCADHNHLLNDPHYAEYGFPSNGPQPQIPHASQFVRGFDGASDVTAAADLHELRTQLYYVNAASSSSSSSSTAPAAYNQASSSSTQQLLWTPSSQP